ncbi:MAG: acyl--CoA ligase [Hyphomicrobiales bacterium]|nr:acyl--CoA ligase [Hyphomicrobiales bacterium]
MADAQRGLDPLNISIDRLLTVSAAFRPDALFLADPSDKDAICGVQAGTITIGEADKKVTEIARFLTTIGLRAGDAVLLRMPNTVEAYLTILGIWRAGLTLCALPLAFRSREWREPLERIAPKALITCGRIGDEDATAIAYALAGENFSIRFVGAFYGADADGIICLDQALAGNSGKPQEDETASGVDGGSGDGGTLASLHLFETPSGPAILPHSHRSLTTNAAIVIGEAKLRAEHRIVQPFLPSGLTGLAGGLVTGLLAGAPLLLHHPFSHKAMAEQMAACTHALLPSLLADEVLAGRPPASLEGIISVMPFGQGGNTKPCAEGTPKCDEIGAFGDFALLPVIRDKAGDPAVALGEIRSDTAPRGRVDPAGAFDLPGVPRKTFESGAKPDRLMRISGDFAPDAETMKSFNIGGNSAFLDDDEGVVVPVMLGESSAKDMAPVGALIDGYGLIGAMPVALSKLDRDASSLKGIEKAAFSPGFDGLSLAVVPETPAPIDQETIVSDMAANGYGLHKLPETVANMTTLPRHSDGRANRTAIRGKTASAGKDR